jgi:hypothetical protein
LNLYKIKNEKNNKWPTKSAYKDYSETWKKLEVNGPFIKLSSEIWFLATFTNFSPNTVNLLISVWLSVYPYLAIGLF